MKQLYQVRDYKDHETVLMIAPLSVISSIFKLHKFAEDRIKSEAKDGCCHLCFNNRPTPMQTSGSVLISEIKHGDAFRNDDQRLAIYSLGGIK